MTPALPNKYKMLFRLDNNTVQMAKSVLCKMLKDNNYPNSQHLRLLKAPREKIATMEKPLVSSDVSMILDPITLSVCAT